MKANTKRLLDELRQSTEGLMYLSEAEYPIEPFIWDVAENGELTPEKLMASEGFLQQVEVNEAFPQNLTFHGKDRSDAMQAEDQKQQELIDFLRSRCKTIEVYIAQKNDAPDEPFQKFEAFPFILVETQAGEWLGIAPEVEADFQRRMQAEVLLTDYDPYWEKEFWQIAFWRMESALIKYSQELAFRQINPSLLQQKADFYIRFDLQSLLEKSNDIKISWSPTGSLSVRDFLIKQEGAARLLEILTNRELHISTATLELASEIKEMLVGMKLFVTAYYQKHEEITRFILRTATSKASALADLLYATGFCGLYQFVKFSDEAEPCEYDLAEQQRYERLESLDQLLLSNLSNLREYVVGCMSVFYLYSIGQTAEGDWVGVRTVAVLT